MDLSGSMQGAGGVGGLLAVTEGSETYYPTYDGNGNVSEYLQWLADDPATEEVDDEVVVSVAHYEYDPFGNDVTPLAKKGSKHDDFDHRFSTKPMDADTGLYYYGYRYYDPVTGRWPSRDPMAERGGINLYVFVDNNSAGSFDYLGLATKCCCGGKAFNTKRKCCLGGKTVEGNNRCVIRILIGNKCRGLE